MAPTNRIRQWGAVVCGALLVTGAFVAACSSDNSNPQPTPVYNVGDSGTPVTTPDSGPGPVGDDGSTPDDSATPDSAPPPPPQDAAACTTDAGCWSCTPASNSEFLNQCTSSQCSPFANATRLPNYDGGLPPLN